MLLRRHIRHVYAAFAESRVRSYTPSTVTVKNEQHGNGVLGLTDLRQAHVLPRGHRVSVERGKRDLVEIDNSQPLHPRSHLRSTRGV